MTTRLVFFTAAALASLLTVVVKGDGEIAHWNGNTVRDLHREYGNIFKFGNRNAASHLWSSFLIDRAHQMTDEKLRYMFSGFCVVSGSPVGPNDYNRYRLRLPLVTGGEHTGYLHYCCWPCVCDTQDFIRVDTKTILTADGNRTYHWAVLGNPCDHPEELTRPFQQSFGRGMTSLARDAAEVRCGSNGELIGATMSDNGYVIIGMFFDAVDPRNDIAPADATAGALVAEQQGEPQPGRVQTAPDGVLFNDEYDYSAMCADREAHNFNSGMGKIFRMVAAISPIEIPATPQVAKPNDDGAAALPEPGAVETCVRTPDNDCGVTKRDDTAADVKTA